MNSPAWAWNEDSSTIVKKYYFYYLFQERSYLSQSPAQVKNIVLCRTDRMPRETGRVLQLPFSRHHLSLVILSDTNDKHLYFIWAHSCLFVPSQNNHCPRWLSRSANTKCIDTLWARAFVTLQMWCFVIIFLYYYESSHNNCVCSWLFWYI